MSDGGPLKRKIKAEWVLTALAAVCGIGAMAMNRLSDTVKDPLTPAPVNLRYFIPAVLLLVGFFVFAIASWVIAAKKKRG